MFLYTLRNLNKLYTIISKKYHNFCCIPYVFTSFSSCSFSSLLFTPKIFLKRPICPEGFCSHLLELLKAVIYDDSIEYYSWLAENVFALYTFFNSFFPYPYYRNLIFPRGC